MRVIANTTTHDDEEMNEMVGKELKVKAIYESGSACIYTEAKGSYRAFKSSDFRYLTPVSFNGKRIAKLDWIKDGHSWFQVYGYCWEDGKYVLNCLRKDGSPNKSCYYIYQLEITNHKENLDDDRLKDIPTSDLLSEMKRRGAVKDGLIVE